LKGIKVEENCNSLRVYADPLLENVFFNLFDFTLKHSTGIKTISIRHELQESGALRLLFKDDGESENVIDPELFIYHSGKEDLLVLFMAKEILNMTGIDIRQAQRGESARFIITIPPDKYQF
jgi:K+-sensing histidine kinase KdpD